MSEKKSKCITYVGKIITKSLNFFYLYYFSVGITLINKLIIIIFVYM